MGKKRKKSSAAINSSNSAASSDFCGLQDEIIRNLHVLRLSGGVCVGVNACLRALERDALAAVVFVKGVPSPLFHAFRIACSGRDSCLQLQASEDPSGGGIPSSFAYGIKKRVLLEDPKFSRLRERTEAFLRSRAKRPKPEAKERTEEEEDRPPSQQEQEATAGVEAFFHPRHETHRKVIGGTEDFLSLREYEDSTVPFPDYTCDNPRLSGPIRACDYAGLSKKRKK